MTPEGWALRPLANLVAPLRAGVSVNSEDRQRREGEFGVLKTSALSGGQFNPAAHKTVLSDELDRVKTSPTKGDILISRMNTPLLVGENAFVPEDFPDLFLPDRLWQMRVNRTSDTSSRWLAYFLQLPGSRDYVKDAAGGTSGSMKNVSQDAFLALEVLCPPLAEQKKIAEILESVDEAIQATQAVIDQTSKVKEGLLQQLLTRGIGHTRFKQTEIGEIPESWEILTADELCSRISVGIVVTPSRYYVNSGVPCFRSANVQVGRVRDADWVYISEASNELHAKSRLKSGDVLVVRTGYPGTSCVVPEKYDGSNCIDVIFARPRLNAMLPEFLSAFINSDLGKKQVLAGQGGLAQQHFNVGELNKMTLGVPSIAEQRQIVDRIGSAQDSTSAGEGHLDQLNRLKRGLMQDLLTGRVRTSV